MPARHGPETLAVFVRLLILSIAISAASHAQESDHSKHVRNMRAAIAEAEQRVDLPKADVALHRVIFRDLRDWTSAGLSQHLATFATCSPAGTNSVCVWTLGTPPSTPIEVWCVVRAAGEVDGEIHPDRCVVYPGSPSEP